VLGGSDALTARHAESSDSGMLQRQLADFLEILEILRVRQRVTALDEIDAQLIQPLGDEQLVLKGEVDAFPLAAVAERGVVDRDAGHFLSPNKKALKPNAPGPRCFRCAARSRAPELPLANNDVDMAHSLRPGNGDRQNSAHCKHRSIP